MYYDRDIVYPKKNAYLIPSSFSNFSRYSLSAYNSPRSALAVLLLVPLFVFWTRILFCVVLFCCLKRDITFYASSFTLLEICKA